jgi:hypothetical protein
MTSLLFWRGSFPVLLILLGSIAVGCLPPVKAAVSVTDLASTFPTLDRLAVRSYEFRRFNDGEPVCESFHYARGAFTSIPGDEFCAVFHDDPDPRPVPIAFDAQALADLAVVKIDFARMGVPIQQIYIHSDSEGSVGRGSAFAADRCVIYVYDPGWAVLPEQIPGDSISSGLTADWYKTDSCP